MQHQYLTQFGAKNLGEYLRQEYQRRNARNQRYSLRAFARSIKQDPSTISKLMSGKRRASRRLIENLSTQLGIPNELTEQFTKVRGFDGRIKCEEISYKQMNDEEINTIIHWYYTPIFLLTELDDFEPTCPWVAKKLGLPLETIEKAVAILQHSGLLHISQDGKWTAPYRSLTTERSSHYSTPLLKQAQLELLQKAQEALMTIPIEARDNSSLVMAFRREDVPLVRSYLRRVRRRLDSLAQKSAPKNAIYATTIAFFPLS